MQWLASTELFCFGFIRLQFPNSRFRLASRPRRATKISNSGGATIFRRRQRRRRKFLYTNAYVLKQDCSARTSHDVPRATHRRPDAFPAFPKAGIPRATTTAFGGMKSVLVAGRPKDRLRRPRPKDRHSRATHRRPTACIARATHSRGECQPLDFCRR